MDVAHRARIQFEWSTGQWDLLAPGDQFHGWISWYRCTDEVLDLLRAERFDELIRRDKPDDFTQGPNVYIATTVVAPWAPPDTYRWLFLRVCTLNRGASRIAAHINKRDGRRRWYQRPVARYLPPLH